MLNAFLSLSTFIRFAARPARYLYRSEMSSERVNLRIIWFTWFTNNRIGDFSPSVKDVSWISPSDKTLKNSKPAFLSIAISCSSNGNSCTLRSSIWLICSRITSMATWERCSLVRKFFICLLRILSTSLCIP